MSEWIPAFLLPNIYIKHPVETDLACLVSCDDLRVQALAEAHPNLRSFLDKFTDPFGVKLRPSLIIMRPQERWTIEAIASFRDIVALSVIPHHRAATLIYPVARPAADSDCVDFYPWMLGNDYKRLICNTPGLMAMHVVERFNGQSSPVLSPVQLDRMDYDTTLLKALLERWQRRYTAVDPLWEDLALFRSIDMAMAASKMPAGPDMTVFGLGRSLSMWVSAFETLVHPGTRSGSTQVYELLDRVPWKNEQCQAKTHTLGNGQPANLGCWIYSEIYDARNDFLHGNKVTNDRLIVPASGQSLFKFAAPLYRMALTGFLGMRSTPDPSKEFDRDEFDFLSDQRDFERALLKVLSPVDPDDI